MQNLFSNKASRILLITSAFVLISVFGLWSWNTVAELFNGPQAEYKHAIAVFSLLGIVRLFTFHHFGKHSQASA